MRLTFVNFIVRKKPHGYAYRGKYRIVKPVKLPELRQRFDELHLQEQNMLYLRHPYLTVEQSMGHKKALRELQGETAGFQPHLRRNAKFARWYTWAEQLSHLRVKDAWE